MAKNPGKERLRLPNHRVPPLLFALTFENREISDLSQERLKSVVTVKLFSTAQGEVIFLSYEISYLVCVFSRLHTFFLIRGGVKFIIKRDFGLGQHSTELGFSPTRGGLDFL